MGQVPGRASLLLIGDGRLAGHLDFYLRAKELPVTRWSRRRDPLRALPGLVRRSDRVLLAIRDDALPDFLRAHRRDGDPLWIHFSGSAVVDGAWSAHPLGTFSGPPYPREVYEQIPFIVEREGPPFEELLPGLGNPSAPIPRAAKPLYHALCVAAGNFTQLLWQELFHGFEERLGLPAELALPYLRATAGGLERGLADGRRDVLTGPIARRDRTTVRGNLQALRGAGLGELAGVYEAFLDLAAKGRTTPMGVAA